MTHTIRAAEAGDLDALMALERESYPDDAWSPELMAAELANPHGYYLVAIDESGAVAGYAGLLAPVGTGQGDIQTVTVASTARRQGLGRRLLERLLAEAARRGAEELFLEVRHDNVAAQTLYRDLGFVEIGVRRNYYGHGVDALTMRRTA
jgi:ribosomal-protein-alanine acetyltransferase